MKIKLLSIVLVVSATLTQLRAATILIPMDEKGQTNHLKAYGVAFAAMQGGTKVDWLLNYKGGSFGIESNGKIEQLCTQRGVSFIKLSTKDYAKVVKEVKSSSFNGQLVQLEKVPRIAVYTPLNKMPWDDAVTMALTYAEIPFDKIYADEVLKGDLEKYDWLHLHHEDFTGQHSKFWSLYSNADWYKNEQATMEQIAARNGYKKVSELQLAVVKKIKGFVATGGNMFAMCTATETFDITLAADGTDISASPFDGDRSDPDADKKLDFSKSFAFKDFTLFPDPYSVTHSSIDNTSYRHVSEGADNFKLIAPPGKLDAVPVMLCQNHTDVIHGFMGKTTAFRKDVIKPDVMVLGDRLQVGSEYGTNERYLQDYEARYIHGEYEKGSWTFLGGHDPEDYSHHIGDPQTDLSKFPHSPGYRLILNNVLFPSAPKSTAPTIAINGTKNAAVAPTAVNEAVAPVNKISIAPNPANDELIITIQDGKIEQVSVLNIAGQEMISKTINAAKANISLGSLPAGLYLIKVNNEYAGKVVKN